jgi:hypothetical protein
MAFLPYANAAFLEAQSKEAGTSSLCAALRGHFDAETVETSKVMMISSRISRLLFGSTDHTLLSNRTSTKIIKKKRVGQGLPAQDKSKRYDLGKVICFLF